MDLALELGMPAQQLRETMTELELALWVEYARKKFLPTRRIEVYLAQIAKAMAGGTIADYLLDMQKGPAPLTSGEGASALGSIAGGIGVRVLGKKRKKKGG
jgi:hypothetical protein